MTTPITRLFDDRTAAIEAVRKLEAAGLQSSEISMVSSNADNWYSGDRSTSVDRDRDGVDDRAEAAGTDAGVGTAIGGAAGLLAGLGILAIPGLCPVVAAGWLASTVAGMAVGAATGGLIGALTQLGVPEEEAHAYAEGVRRGGTLVTARVPDNARARYEQILNSSSVNITDRAAEYRKTGWSKFDPSAQPYSSDQIRKERELYGTRRGA